MCTTKISSFACRTKRTPDASNEPSRTVVAVKIKKDNGEVSESESKLKKKNRKKEKLSYHSNNFACFAYMFLAHFKHDALPISTPYSPGKQGKQDALAVYGITYPEGHSIHDVFSARGWYNPFLQSKHTFFVVKSCTRPTLQAEHDALPISATHPEGQSTQVIALLYSANSSAKQILHLILFENKKLVQDIQKEKC